MVYNLWKAENSKSVSKRSKILLEFERLLEVVEVSGRGEGARTVIEVCYAESMRVGNTLDHFKLLFEIIIWGSNSNIR